MRSTFGNTYMGESTYIFYDEESQIYSKNRSGMADEAMHDSLYLLPLTLVLLKKRWCQRHMRKQGGKELRGHSPKFYNM